MVYIKTISFLPKKKQKMNEFKNWALSKDVQLTLNLTKAEVSKVLDEDVGDVLAAHWAGLKEPETSLEKK